MNIPFILEIRKTHKYVGTYQHLDAWEEIGTGTITHSRVTHEDLDDPCEYTKKIFVCEVVSNAPDKDVERAIYSGFSQHGCAHEYDCCGCWSTAVIRVRQLRRPTRLSPSRWAFITSSSRNY